LRRADRRSVSQPLGALYTTAGEAAGVNEHVPASVTGQALPAAMLARRQQLPLKFAPVTLNGALVDLVPLEIDRDAAVLHARSNGQSAALGTRTIEAYDADTVVWRYLFSGPFATVSELAAYLRSQAEAPNGLCLCVVDRATGSQVGVVNFMNNVPEHLKVELGGIWYSPLVQRTGANAEATYLMLRHAFALGYRRVEWKCDALNARSRHAALRMGFTFEGIQDAHYIIKDRNRDTAWFRILATEWPAVQAQLERLLTIPA
jgi:RimJ/RimL family protein N-acetyltransferase